MARALQIGCTAESVNSPEEYLSARDPIMAKVVRLDVGRWPTSPNEPPIWGLIRIVVAQQVTTRLASRLAAELRAAYPELARGSMQVAIDPSKLRAMGVPERRARCCCEIATRAEYIVHSIREGASWEQALRGIKGIGPWTIAVFRIMVLRDPDVLPLGDVGLNRAIANTYGSRAKIEVLDHNWRPFRSVACWYLWRTLGNEQLG